MQVLRTDRLTLRWLAERDSELVPRWLEDAALAQVTRALRTVDDARAWIAEVVTGYWRDGHGAWVIERRSDGEALGICGLVSDPSGRDLSLVCAVDPRFRRSGYGREAASACVRYGRDALGAGRIVALAPPGDRAALRLVESIGMTPDSPVAGAGAAFAWETGRDEADDRSAIDDLVRRFFRAFTNRDAVPLVVALPSMFLPRAIVTIVKPAAPAGIETLTVPEFMAPRAQLLFGGRLVDFDEHELESDTRIVQGLAQRSCRYRKAGTLDGAHFEGGGNKLFQLVRDSRRWRIAALAWEDIVG